MLWVLQCDTCSYRWTLNVPFENGTDATSRLIQHTCLATYGEDYHKAACKEALQMHGKVPHVAAVRIAEAARLKQSRE